MSSPSKMKRMKRRNFLGNTGLAVAATVLPISCAMAESPNATPKYELGYQLYSIRDEMAKDPLATLKALKAMGYVHFEIYGYDPVADTIYGYEPKAFKKVLDDLGLTVTSGHYGFADYLNKSEAEMTQFVDKCISCSTALDSPYITWPWMAPEQRNLETYKSLPPILNKIGAQVKAAGLQFTYHNHGFEFDDYDGENCYDMILNQTDPDLVKIQVDMYWVMHAATTTPKELVEKHPGRFVMWHIKDLDATNRDYTELGNGAINYINVLPDPVESGLVYYYIEQGGNFAVNSTQSARDSAAYLKEHLQHML